MCMVKCVIYNKIIYFSHYVIGAMLKDGFIIVTIQYTQKNTNLQKLYSCDF